MDKLTQWIALTVVAALGILVGGWLLFVAPPRSEAAELRGQAAAQDVTNAQLETQLQVLRARAENLPQQQAELAKVATKIPHTTALPSLLRALTRAGRAAGVEVDAITPGAPAPVVPPAAAAPAPGASTAPAPGAAAAPAAGAPAGGAPLSAVPLTLKVTGDFYELEQFVAGLEDLPRALRITGLTLTAVEGVEGEKSSATGTHGGSLTTTITGQVFLATGAPATGAPATGAGTGTPAPAGQPSTGQTS